MTFANALSPVPIRPFSGGTSYTVEEFLTTVDYVSTAPRTPGSLFAYLEGRARFWLTHYAMSNTVPGTEEGYAILRSALLGEFSLDPNMRDTREAYHAFRALTQYTAGVQEYADAYRRAARDGRFSIEDHFNRMWWVLGLREEIRETLCERLPLLLSWREIVAEAVWIEREKGLDADAGRREPRESRDSRERDREREREKERERERRDHREKDGRHRHGHESGETLDLSRLNRSVQDTLISVVNKAKGD
ncbi:hypothetical protein A1Q1_04846 [Trichosporon asahii var. asahii CBS 2479]|uniref:Retrotransposon gag domain-containing protein n=1 Tax=Trichosporon asahii var. asahii (strain ATCC 90039 / CBS 2479 / JCM 2466 / KCTC 7840 / NBRC 103889/ NCYC 2677 / UAMH 7654) TaxID=1186058 RepID=J5SN39_TRIAS|nr:hypothetical protein A1Q1_04846 [Trichosporon asahii var. asahii CBS 2479]EJT46551.1 hypothetical protein A1Q1_04846 [Trichosporon asahii var. asahii CBS 2479]